MSPLMLTIVSRMYAQSHCDSLYI